MRPIRSITEQRLQYLIRMNVIDKICEANPDGTISPNEGDEAQAIYDDVQKKLEALLGDATTQLAKVGGWARTSGMLQKLDNMVKSVANRTIANAPRPETPRLSPEEREAVCSVDTEQSGQRQRQGVSGMYKHLQQQRQRKR